MTRLQNTLQLISVSSNSKITNHLCNFVFFLLKLNGLTEFKVTVCTLPKQVKKYTLLKSPHIYKSARTQLESRQVKTVLTIVNFTEKNVQECLNFFKLIFKQLPLGIKVILKKKHLTYIS